jgi:hypothetical protein
MVNLALWRVSEYQRGDDDAHAQEDLAKVLFHAAGLSGSARFHRESCPQFRAGKQESITHDRAA